MYRPGKNHWTQKTSNPSIWDEFDHQPDVGSMIPFELWLDEVRKLAIQHYDFKEGFVPSPNAWRPYYEDLLTPVEALIHDKQIVEQSGHE